MLTRIQEYDKLFFLYLDIDCSKGLEIFFDWLCMLLTTGDSGIYS